MSKFALCILLVVVACSSEKAAKRNKSKQQDYLHDSLRVHFMRMESAIYGDFVQLRRFHSDLMQEIELQKSPYPEMDSVFHLLHVAADSVIIQRLHFDNGEFSQIDELLSRANYYRIQYGWDRVLYEQLREHYNIERYDLRHFGELIDVKINEWNDSLEEAGRIMANCKNHLRSSGLVQNSKEYIQKYQPISQIELGIKQLSASIMQLQNAESRFSEANVEEFYYTGPYLRPRREIIATEGIVSEIALHMADIHKWKSLYYAGY